MEPLWKESIASHRHEGLRVFPGIERGKKSTSNAKSPNLDQKTSLGMISLIKLFPLLKREHDNKQAKFGTLFPDKAIL